MPIEGNFKNATVSLSFDNGHSSVTMDGEGMDCLIASAYLSASAYAAIIDNDGLQDGNVTQEIYLGAIRNFIDAWRDNNGRKKTNRP